MQIVQKANPALYCALIASLFLSPAYAAEKISNSQSLTEKKVLSAEPAVQKIALTGTDLILTDDLALSIKQAEDNPNSPEAHFNLAVAYSRTVEVEKALDAIKTTKKLIKKSKDPDAINHTFDKYIKVLSAKPSEDLTNYRLAFLHFLKAYLNEKKDKKTLDGQISNFTKQIKAEKAKEKLDQAAIDRLKSVKKSLKKKRENLHASPEYMALSNKAIDYMDKVLAKSPDDVWTLSYKGYLIYDQGNNAENFKKAKKLWKKAIVLDPKNPAPHMLLGDAHMKNGDPASGFKEVTKAMLLRAEQEASKTAESVLETKSSAK